MDNLQTRLRVTHIIVGLNIGGAEQMLVKLLTCMDRAQFECRVISLTDIGALGQKLLDIGIPVDCIAMNEDTNPLTSLKKIVRILKREKPDVVQTWMYHADFIGGLAARMAGVKGLVWGVHQANLAKSLNTSRTLFIAGICARLSNFLPCKIVCCSEASRKTHVDFGYSSRKMVVIPNGFEIEAYRPNPLAREEIRAELGLAPNTPLIGLVARFDPQKDHRSFILAAAILSKVRPDAHFLCCGKLIDKDNAELVSWIEAENLMSRFHLLGNRSDVPKLDAAMDLLTSSSLGEGFPNFVGEAMSCGTPCVVTDVGDSAFLVGETGKIVPPGDPEALAAGWLELLEKSASERKQLGNLARERIIERFEIGIVTKKYEETYQEMRLKCAG